VDRRAARCDHGHVASHIGQAQDSHPAPSGRTSRGLRRRGGLYSAGFTKHGWPSKPHSPSKNAMCRRWDTLGIPPSYRGRRATDQGLRLYWNFRSVSLFQRTTTFQHTTTARCFYTRSRASSGRRTGSERRSSSTTVQPMAPATSLNQAFRPGEYGTSGRRMPGSRLAGIPGCARRRATSLPSWTRTTCGVRGNWRCK
jgi:hypothetical protein